MKTIVPFSKKINLETTIYEITSISLEHEIRLAENVLSGDFIISGDYKTHELSINKDPFSYRLPFEVELGENVDLNSVNFDIVDFNYELIKDIALQVNIEFSVEAEEKEIEEIPEVEERVIEEIEIEDRDIKEDEIEDILEEVKEEEEEIVEERLNEEIDLFTEKVEIEDSVEDLLETTEEKKLEKLAPEMENEIINNVVSGEDVFVTYHVHIVTESETIESICSKYDVGVDLIKQYNDVNDILVGDKLLIPVEVDE